MGTELGQLALGAGTAPAAVLPAEAHDQLDELGAHRRPLWPPLPSPRPPFTPPGFSVPAEQRPRRNEEGAPAFPGEQPAEGGEERALSRPVPDAAMELALKGTDLVAEDDQFDVLVYVVAPA